MFVGSVPYGKTVDAGRAEAGAWRVTRAELQAFKRVMAEARSQARIGDRIQRERVADHNKRSRRQWDAPDRVRFTYNPYVTVDADGRLPFKGDPVSKPNGWFDLAGIDMLVPPTGDNAPGGVHWVAGKRINIARVWVHAMEADVEVEGDVFVTPDLFSSFTHLIETVPVRA